MATNPAASQAVHRSLHLTTPLMNGPDVEQLQAVMRAFMQDHRIDWLPLAVDGELGPQTMHAARFLTWVLGLGPGHRRPIQKHNTLAQATQRLLRDPAKRSARERGRQKRRQARLEEIRKRQAEGPKAAVAYAFSFVGTTESPAGTNSGPSQTNAKGQKGGVSFWESYWGLGPCFWCLCFASYCAKAIGRAKISGNCVFSVEIERMARAHENGWVAVPLGQERPGDISLWSFDGGQSDHGELVVGPYLNDRCDDVGGNTGSGPAGSQSNGGGVFHRTDRDLSQLTCIARPLYD